jgi:thioredoxin-like negative regulator of GroEL
VRRRRRKSLRHVTSQAVDARIYFRDLKVCKVNVDTNQELASHYGITSIPAILIFKDGKIAAQHVGVMPAAICLPLP